ncbi:phage virion morphogenesis protein [Pseudonocardia sp. 73-21]|uniref:phage virion morphogenesis protein n=1 Tax=Pseudonocardia sp. 73-21 TaxID=1895809 RepID=UPI0009594EFB|nr:phage virion morphogenesis protein [Pseudonocardia sp. 73-21]OJY53538.1 MAG: hypothetical protein BGP03_17540 [Pseudonocardia sp. 73-21]
MVQFNIEVPDTGAAESMFDRLIANANTLQDTAFPLIRDDFHRVEAQRFDSHGPGWAPLTPATIGIKTRRGMPQPETPMHGTGRLQASLTGSTADSVYETTPDSMLVGTSAPYAQFHQVGPRQIRVFGRGHATLPRRPLVQLSSTEVERWAVIIAAALLRPGRSSGPTMSVPGGSTTTALARATHPPAHAHLLHELIHTAKHARHQAHRLEHYLNRRI